MERSATPLFGFVTYGVHMTVCVPPTQFQPMQIWTPVRSSSKPTYPGMLDNSLPLPYSQLPSLINPFAPPTVPLSLLRQLFPSPYRSLKFYIFQVNTNDRLLMGLPTEPPSSKPSSKNPQKKPPSLPN